MLGGHKLWYQFVWVIRLIKKHIGKIKLGRVKNFIVFHYFFLFIYNLLFINTHIKQNETHINKI